VFWQEFFLIKLDLGILFITFIEFICRIGIIAFTLLSISGLAIFALSASRDSFTEAIIGRALFGIGAEC
jgi:nitrate/nitrite transporter NarK